MMKIKFSLSICAVILTLSQFTTPYTLKFDKVINFRRLSLETAYEPLFHSANIEKLQDDDGPQKVACPTDFVFNATERKCTQRAYGVEGNHGSEKKYEEDVRICPKDRAVLLPHPTDCRRYVNCWQGQQYVQECGSGLTFDNSTKQCNWPEQANCCEYI